MKQTLLLHLQPTNPTELFPFVAATYVLNHHNAHTSADLLLVGQEVGASASYAASLLNTRQPTAPEIGPRFWVHQLDYATASLMPDAVRMNGHAHCKKSSSGCRASWVRTPCLAPNWSRNLPHSLSMECGQSARPRETLHIRQLQASHQFYGLGTNRCIWEPRRGVVGIFWTLLSLEHHPNWII